jgi:transposase-like protein
MERRKFTREFKLEAVRLIKDRNVSYVQASQDLNVQMKAARTILLFTGQNQSRTRCHSRPDDILSNMVTIPSCGGPRRCLAR